MRILLLTDRMDIGGAETHIFELARSLCAKGHSVIVASSGGRTATRLVRDGVRHLTLPLGSKCAGALFESCFSLLRLIKREKIEIIHAHARFPALISAFLSKFTGALFVTTAHAKFSLKGLRGKLSCWGEGVIAVSEDIKQYLIDGYGIFPTNVEVIPNGMDCGAFLPRYKCDNALSVGFLSRLDNDCAEGARMLCRITPSLVRKYGKIRIMIGGGGEAYPSVSSLAKKINEKVGFLCIECVGNVCDIPSFMNEADIFIGVSRAACEAVLCGASVILCGNEGFMGYLTPENFERALAGNFCARGYKKADEKALFREINRVVFDKNRKETQEKTRELLISACDILKVASRTENFYKNALRKHKRGGDDVLLCGYYGFDNVGDDALLRASAERAEREFRGAKISALTKNGRCDEKKFAVKCVKRSSPFGVALAIAKCRFFVLGGGTLLQDGTSLRSLAYYTLLLRLAHFFGAKCYVWGGGIGELKRKISKIEVRKTLLDCEYVGVRDKRSAKVAKMFGARDVRGEEDLACKLLPSSKARADAILQRFFGKGEIPPFVIVAIKRKMSKQTLREIIKAKKRGREVVFVVMHRGEDLLESRNWSERLGGHLLDGICFEDLCAIAKESCGVYSMRLHALIAARLAGAPAYPIGNEDKIKDFASGRMYISTVDIDKKYNL